MLDGWKTLTGAVVALVAQIAAMSGFTFDVVGVTNSIVTLAGLVLAIYGRMVAHKAGWLAPK